MPVYVVGARVGAAVVKIGWTIDIGKRMCGLQTGSADRLAVLRLIDCEPAGERWMHARYKHLRTNGEWFRSDPEMFTVEVPVTQPAPPREKPPVTLHTVQSNPRQLLGKARPEMIGRVFDYDTDQWVKGAPDRLNQYALFSFNNIIQSHVSHAVSVGIPADRIAEVLRVEIQALLKAQAA